MLCSFTSAVVLSLGHHLFNEGLNGEPVPTGEYRPLGALWTLSKQQLNSSMGVGFAFFVRTFLVVAASASYVQVLWSSVKKRQSPVLAELDWAFAGLDNFFNLFDFRHGKKYPALLTLALVTWCVPLATIFPPATLLVEVRPVSPTEMRKVPLLDFSSMKFAAPMATSGNSNESTYWQFNGASQPLQNVALAIMSRGAILPIHSPAPNASWSQQFWGPELRCQHADASSREQIFVNIWNSYNVSGSGSLGYLSWVPWSSAELSLWRMSDAIESAKDLPFVPSLYWHNLEDPSLRGPPTSQIAGDGPASLWFVAIPHGPDVRFPVGIGLIPSETPDVFEWRHDNRTMAFRFSTIDDLTDSFDSLVSGVNETLSVATIFADATLLRCDLLNSSYTVGFNFTNGVQTVNIESNTTGDSPVLYGSDIFTGAVFHGAGHSGNCSPFLAGMTESYDNDCTFNLEALRLLAYQSISAAFNELLLGAIRDEIPDGVMTTTDIMKTLLAQTSELAFLRDWSVLDVFDETGSSPSFQAEVAESQAWAYQGISTSRLPPARMDLKSTLEELFQNLTVSLLAEPYFQ